MEFIRGPLNRKICLDPVSLWVNASLFRSRSNFFNYFNFALKQTNKGVCANNPKAVNYMIKNWNIRKFIKPMSCSVPFLLAFVLRERSLKCSIFSSLEVSSHLGPKKIKKEIIRNTLT